MKINCIITLLAINILLLLQSNNAFTMQNIEKTNNQDVKQENNSLVEYEYGDIWNNEKIQDAVSNVAEQLEHYGYDYILLKLNDVALSVISNIDYNAEEIKKASEQYLNYIIKKTIVSKNNSLEENIENILWNVPNDSNSKNAIWKIIIEDYSEKYITNNKELNNNLIKIQNSLSKSEEIKTIAQQYTDKISKKLGNAFSAINNDGEYDYFENKFYNNKQDNEKIIFSHLLNIFTNTLKNN